MQKLDIADHWTRERANSKRRFYKLKIVIVFDSLLIDIPMCCKDTVLLELLWKNHKVNCLSSEKNTRQPYIDHFCLFRALALHLHGKDKFEDETAKIVNFFLFHCEEGNPQSFRMFTSTTFQNVKTCCSSIFLYMILLSLTENSLVKLLFEMFKKRQNCQVFALQRSHLLRQQHQRVSQIFPMHYL